MGDDSTPRNVLSICSGEEEMFEIVPLKGKSFTVNSSHILTLYASGQGRICRNRDKYVVSWFNGTRITSKILSSRKEAEEYSTKIIKEHSRIFDISLKNYLTLPKGHQQVLKSFWVLVDYPSQTVPVDPYFIGIWLCDASSHQPAITTVDSEIGEYLGGFSERNNLRITVSQTKNKVPTYHLVEKTGRGRSHHYLPGGRAGGSTLRYGRFHS